MNKIKIGLTQGDINGIGYEVIIKSLLDNRMNDLCTSIIYGSPKVAAYHRKALNVNNFNLNQIQDTNSVNVKRVNIINCIDDEVRVELGKSTVAGGDAAFKALEKATEDLGNGKIDAIVTAPINKKNIQSESFNFSGHTEYLQAKFKSDKVLMLMVGDYMKVGVVTGHLPLNKVAENITQESIIEKLELLNHSLLQDFGIRKPTIAVLGLNPHAGDDGLLGSEEKEIIIPAIEKARNKGIMAIGPYAADGFFGTNAYLKFDAILAMYHDQGLAPFKAAEFDNGVNFTAGLPIIRTSPVHGTAYEIAGEGQASPNSFRKAMYLAIEIHKNRKLYKEISANPLPTEK